MKEDFPSINEQGKNLAKFTFEVVKNVIDISPFREVISERSLRSPTELDSKIGEVFENQKDDN